MKLEESNLNCQVPDMQYVAEGTAEIPPASLLRHVKLVIRRSMSPSTERAFKRFTNHLMNRLYKYTNKGTKPTASPLSAPLAGLQVGDKVLVRSLSEIEATLNNWRQLRGCTFMPEMVEYCETTQRVLKPMLRFVDERDLRVKKSRGIVLLEGVMCQGTADFGSCDRSCFYFWREEWLEKIG
jgi:hypothetical protein